MSSTATPRALTRDKPGTLRSSLSAKLNNKARAITPTRGKQSIRENTPLKRVQKEDLDAINHANALIRLDAIQGAREAKINVKTGVSKEVARLQDQAAMYFRRIQVERRKVAELEEQVNTAQMKVLEQKQKMGGVNASKENDAILAKQTQLLENRLDKTLVKFNQALGENKRLRERIDRLRMDRVVYDNVYKRLERCLHEKKKEMAQVIEDAKRVCVARDKAKSEINNLKQQAEKEKAEFQREWAELGRLIEEDRQARDSIEKTMEAERRSQRLSEQSHRSKSQAGRTGLVTSKPRDNSSGNSPMDVNKQSKGDESGIPGEVVSPDRNALNEKSSSATASAVPLSSSIITTAPLLSLTPEKIRLYEEVFAQVQEATGLTDIEKMVTKFLEAEEKNFSLFNYVNDLNTEIDELESFIGENKNEIEKNKDQGSNADSRQKRLARAGEERQQQIKAKADEYELKYIAATKAINQLKTSIHSIFSRLGCATTTPMEEILGNQGVTESNMMQYLGFIEQRTIEILQLYRARQSRDATSSLNEAAHSSSTPFRITVQPPSLSEIERDEEAATQPHAQATKFRGYTVSKTIKSINHPSFEEDDAEDRPLTRQELQEKAVSSAVGKSKQQKSSMRPCDERQAI